MVPRAAQNTAVILLIIGVAMAAGDASRLVCEYLCATNVDHGHSDSKIDTVNSTGNTASHSRAERSLLSSPLGAVSASDEHGTCGPIDSITVASNQANEKLNAPPLSTAGSPLTCAICSAVPIYVTAASFESPPHAPPKLALETSTSLRI